MSALSVADVLDRAADLIEPEGAWTQGWLYRDAQGRAIFRRPEIQEVACMCLNGALMLAAESAMVPQKPFALVKKVLRGKEPALWNDAPNRTQSEVVAKLRQAAALARREPSNV